MSDDSEDSARSITFHDNASPLTFVLHELPRATYYRRKCQIGLSSGTVPSPTARLMLLGDAGVGKTSTLRQLLSKDHVESHEPTEAVETSMAEESFADNSWLEIPRNSVRNALTHALSFFCASKRNVLPRTHWFILMNVIAKLIAFYILLHALIFLSCVFLEKTFSMINFLSFVSNAIFSLSPMNAYFVGVEVTLFVFFWIFNRPYLCNSIFLLIFVVDLILCFPTEIQFCKRKFTSQVYTCMCLVWPGEFLVALLYGIVRRRFFPILRITDCGTFFLLQLSSIFEILKSTYGSLSLRNFVYSVLMCNFLLSLQCIQSRLRALSFDSMFLLSIYGITCVTQTYTSRSMTHHFNFLALGFIIGDIMAWRVKRMCGVQEAFPRRSGWIVVIEVCVSGFSLICADQYFEVYAKYALGDIRVLLFFVIIECFYWFVIKKDVNLSLRSVMKLADGSNGKAHTNLSILDCGGQEIYHSAHHIYMCRHALYLVVFRLTDLCRDFERTESRIRFWLSSVAAHAQHPDAKVLLVATHSADVPSAEQRDEALLRLREELEERYCRLVGRNFTQNTFCIDNKWRRSCLKEIHMLKAAIQHAAFESEFVARPSRVVWYRFLDTIRRVRLDGGTLLVRRSDLWMDMRVVCDLSGEAEFERLLQLFHDRGEIFFEHRHPLLSDFVLLDPTVLETAVRRLFSLKLSVVSQDRLLTSLEDIRADPNLLLPLLEALGFVLSWRTSGDLFLIPHNLRERCGSLLRRVAFVARFDFGAFDPNPIFLRLLASCVAVGAAPRRIFRNAALLRMEGGPRFSLEVPNDHKVWIRIAQEAKPKAVLELLYQLEHLMRHVCFTHFKFAAYRLEMVCRCSVPQVQDDHRQAACADFLEIIDFSDLPTSKLLKCFPNNEVKYVCNRDPWYLDSIDGREVAEQRVRLEARLRPLISLELTPARDVFVSCPMEERAFCFGELLPVLESPHALCHLVPEDVRPVLRSGGVSVAVDFRDDASPGWDCLWSSARRRLPALGSCRMLLAVISPRGRCEECRKELTFALNLPLPVIPIVLDGARLPDELLALSCVYWDRRDRYATQLYVDLLRAVRGCLDRG